MKPAKSGSDGFTVLEVLVALSVTALVLAALPPTLRMANTALKYASASLDTDETDRALDLIEQKLSGAIPIFQHSPDGLLDIAFTGANQSISFVAPLLHTSDSGLFRYTLAAVPSGDQESDVVLRLQPYQPDRPDLPIVETRILRRNATLTLRYLGPSTAAGAPQWADAWVPRDNLPKLVSLTVSQPRLAPQARVVELHLRSRNDLN